MAKRINLSRHLKMWRKRMSKELGREFGKHEAATVLGLKYLTFIQYENGRRGSGINQLLYDLIMEKTAPNGTKAKASQANSVE